MLQTGTQPHAHLLHFGMDRYRVVANAAWQLTLRCLKSKSVGDALFERQEVIIGEALIVHTGGNSEDEVVYSRHQVGAES